jgi:hypothetical protein
MPNEKDFETLLAKYPELIEVSLQLRGRQVVVQGRRMDLLFEDTVGRQLIAELKWGPIKDEHVGQLMCYEGLLLSADDPTLRVMLIGTRVPSNIRRSLDHHGIAWREVSLSQISSFLTMKNDPELASIFAEIEKPEITKPSSRVSKTRAAPAHPAISAAAALFIPLAAESLKEAFDYFESGRDELYFVCDANIGQAANLPVHYIYFKVRGETFVRAYAAFVRLSPDNPTDKRLPGNENLAGRYYYGFRNLTQLESPLLLTDLRYFNTGTPLRNDVPGGCIIQEVTGIPALA